MFEGNAPPPVRKSGPLLMKSGGPAIGPQTLEGSRVLLMPVTRAHAEDIFREFTPAVTAWMFPKSATQISEILQFVDAAGQQWQAGTDLTFAILDKATREFLGICAIHGGDHPRRPEFGIWLKSAAHGKALGREAISTLRDWSAAMLLVDGFIYPVDRRNIPSRRIAEHLGGTVIGERTVRSMSGVDLELVVYTLSQRERAGPK